MHITIEKPKRGNPASAASLASMIDIIFLLIIFFIVTASFDNAQLDQKVNIPVISNQVPLKSLPAERLIINILSNGDIKIGFIEVSHDAIASELKNAIASRIHSNNVTVILNGDRNCWHKYISNVMDSLAALGFENIQINAKIENNNGE